MSWRLCFALLVIILGAGTWIFRHQRVALTEASAVLAARENNHVSSRRESVDQQPSQPSADQPSADLLRLRAEVTTLQRELDTPTPRQISKQQAADDWALVHSGPKPSQQPGFIAFASVTNIGFANPEAAFESFNYAMRNQAKEPLNNTRTKDLWDVPDDFDDPSAKYSIDIGEGIGGEVGYRIVSRQTMAANEVRLVLDYENPDGSSFRREKVLVQDRGRWRVRPVSVTRAKAGN
jgi:hypothetical protein